MGGAAERQQRSSSPLKRRASDLDEQAAIVLDVEMASQEDELSSVAVTADSQHPVTSSQDGMDTTGAQTPRRTDGSWPEDEHSAAFTDILTEVPSIDEQIIVITNMVKAFGEEPISEGQKVYLVSKSWIQRVQDRSSESLAKAKVAPVGDVGPIDNSDITKQIIRDSDGKDFVQLKHGLGAESFEMFPETVWAMVLEWYGIVPGSRPIERFAHNTNSDLQGMPNFQFELHPPVFVVHRLWSDVSKLVSTELLDTHPSAPVVTASRSDNYNAFLKRLKKHAQVELSQKVRLWRVPRTLPASETPSTAKNAATPPPSRPTSPGSQQQPEQNEIQDTWKELFLDVDSFAKLERDTQREKIEMDETANAKYNGRTNLAFQGLADDMTLVIDEKIGDSYVLNYVAKKGDGPSIRNGVLQPKTMSSGRTSPATVGPITRGRAQRANMRSLGQVGLANLGNTCYMNSALQCVRSVEEMTKYFLVGSAAEELNRDNPLGNNGDVAMAYSNLLAEIYREPPPPSVAPRAFKNIVGRYAPTFSGYGQQDSQEFVGFLLDGLQEDLSRVKKKPYIEKPDSTDDMVNDHEAIRQMAARVWDITKQRDDSVIADLFTGMYKSTLVCPECGKISITFDPFNNLTLQLPVETPWSHKIFYFPLNDAPIAIQVDLDRSASIHKVKQFISQRVGVPADRLIGAEEYKSKFFKIYKDEEQASEAIGSNDVPCFYELEAVPTNCSTKKNPAKDSKKASLTQRGSSEDAESWDDPAAEVMVVPVFHRHTNREKSRFDRPSKVIAPVPHFIIVAASEARDEESIRRKILEKVATFTDHAIFRSTKSSVQTNTSEIIDPELVITSGSDADSSGDGKIAAQSIDGEDGIVDVTMDDRQSRSAQSSALPSPKPLKVFNERRPAFLNPSSFLAPELQNMFQIGYFVSTSKETIPTGWAEIDDITNKDFPTLSSRCRPASVEQDEETSSVDMVMPEEQDGSSEDDTKSTSSFQPATATRMTEESSDEDDVQPVGRVQRFVGRLANAQQSNIRRSLRPVHARTYGRKQRNQRTYGRRKTSDRLRAAQYDGPSDDAYDDGPLVRLGEGLVVDWTDDAWDALFHGGPDQGSPTYSEIPPLEDPELESRRKARMARRKLGITLDDCLDEFGKEEILSEMDTWYCPRCKDHRRASKKFELWKTPDILIVHLKRFSSVQHRNNKIDVMVDFPIDGLDLTLRVVETEPGKQEIYDLFAVDDHWGGLGGGHYTAFAKNWVDGCWYEYNDASVSKQNDPSRVVTASAYLLFYRRRSDVPLGGSKFIEILSRFNADRAQDEVESGEDQSLGVDSSHRGSPRASVGVGAAHHHGHGIDRNGTADDTNATVVTTRKRQLFPGDYGEHQDHGDAAPILADDAVMNDGIRNVLDDQDEGIDMTPALEYGQPKPLYPQAAWNFKGIENRDDDEADDGYEHGSDIAAGGSSVNSEDKLDRMRDFQDAALDDDYVEDDMLVVPEATDDQAAVSVALAADLKHDLFLKHNAQQYRGERADGGVRLDVDDDDEDDDDQPTTTTTITVAPKVEDEVEAETAEIILDEADELS